MNDDAQYWSNGRDGEKRILLVVDDEQQICEVLTRFVREHFDEIHTATTIEQAEAILARTRVSHLVTDWDLGHHLPRGNELIRRWRTMYGAIRAAYIFTGSALSDLGGLGGVDAIFLKPSGLRDLTSVLARR